MVKVATLFQPEVVISPGIHKTAVIGEGCTIPASASIGPYCVIGKNVVLGEQVIIEAGSFIGENCIVNEKTHLKPRVTLYDNVKIGKHCLIHSGVVLGSDGFGFAQHEGQWVKMPHLAGVTLGNNVEIGANTTIDRGVLEDTVLGDGVIIDNLVQIGHNVNIGDRTAIAALAAIAGSTRIGKACLIGGGAMVGGHLEIADKVYLTATTGVNHSISQPGTYSAGFPAKPNAQWRKNVARFQYLDDMAKRLRVLEKHLGITPPRQGDFATGHDSAVHDPIATERSKRDSKRKSELDQTESMNIQEVLRFLPHRYPFLLVDRVLEFEVNKTLVALKNVTINEHFFQGHFPERAVMPGVLIMEALAQSAAILACRSIDWQPGESLFYLGSIENARFKKMVVPGDQLILRVEILKRRLQVWKFIGTALVDGEVVCTTEMTCSEGKVQ